MEVKPTAYRHQVSLEEAVGVSAILRNIIMTTTIFV